MKAKDTVMDEDEMLACSLVSRYPFRDLVDVIKETCEHQAELSFKAGKRDDLYEALKMSRGIMETLGVAPHAMKVVDEALAETD